MPVAFASSLGGTVTLVGTPPNGIINSMLDQVGIPQFGFFEFGKFGLILFAAGMLYYWAFGYRLLPEDKGGEGPFLRFRTEGTPHPRRCLTPWGSLLSWSS